MHGLNLVAPPRRLRRALDAGRRATHLTPTSPGIPSSHPHQLWHTQGTLLQQTIGDARLTADTLGHRGLASMAGYTKISDHRHGEAYEKIAALTRLGVQACQLHRIVTPSTLRCTRTPLRGCAAVSASFMTGELQELPCWFARRRYGDAAFPPRGTDLPIVDCGVA